MPSSGRGAAVFTRLLRFTLPPALIGAAVTQLFVPAAIPSWSLSLAARWELDPLRAAQLVIAIELFLALVIALSARLARPMCSVAALLLAFSAIAELSGLAYLDRLASVGVVAPLIEMAAAALIFTALERGSSHGERTATKSSVGARSILLALLLAAVAAGVSIRLPISWSVVWSAIVFEPSSWVGRTLPETGVPKALPTLTSLTLEGRHVIIFYNRRCGECHDLFNAFVAGHDHPEVIAIEVPPPSGAALAESDQAADVECPGCTRLALPAGPAWFRHPPVVVVTQDGKVTCVAEKEFERCLH